MNSFHKLPRVPIVSGRQEIILRKCRGKKVLHLGCGDAGLFQERVNRGELMHQRLAEVAGELWGVDIDAHHVSCLREKGFANIIEGDICRLDDIEGLPEKPFDIILASEVIEHLRNPGMFLDSVRKRMVPYETVLMITVPNPFSLDRFLWLLRGIEHIHPDHCSWFSYYTIRNILEKSGFSLEEVCVYSFQQQNILPLRVHLWLKKIRCPGKEYPDEDSARPLASSDPVPLFHTIGSYLKSIPMRVLVSTLYRRTPFWGEGIIVSVKTVGNNA
jgi:SAM-dependent methyltransferase